jgi:hypothetical protein
MVAPYRGVLFIGLLQYPRVFGVTVAYVAISLFIIICCSALRIIVMNRFSTRYALARFTVFWGNGIFV